MINNDYLKDMVSLLVSGTPGTFVYVGGNLDQSMEAKSRLDALMVDKQQMWSTRSSRKNEHITETQRFLFTSTRSVLLGCALRGIRANVIYLDVSPDERVELRNEILPAVASCGGKLL